jgi:hypothetical protein
MYVLLVAVPVFRLMKYKNESIFAGVPNTIQTVRVTPYTFLRVAKVALRNSSSHITLFSFLKNSKIIHYAMIICSILQDRKYSELSCGFGGVVVNCLARYRKVASSRPCGERL